jgi:hypothetical integral membrane protein (TIGR02206 family)
MLNFYIFSEIHNGKFSSYSFTHFFVLVLIFLSTIFFIKSKLWLKKNDKIFRYSFAVFLVTTELVYKYWILDKINSYIELIPLNFCDVTLFITIYSLIKNNKTTANIGLYFSILGGILAIIFPTISYGPSHFRFFHYFAMHYFVIICNFHFVLTEKITISNKANINAIIYANGITLLVFIIDLILKQNWFYLIYSPVKAISDFLGFPLYSILWYSFTSLLMRLSYIILKKLYLKNK